MTAILSKKQSNKLAIYANLSCQARNKEDTKKLYLTVEGEDKT